MPRSVIEAIGNTPLIRLNKASDATGCEILGKAEFMNPGQSVKDRAGLFIIRDAEQRGLLKPGGVIVEGTAGNTGIGLTLVAKALGYRTVIVIPDTQSQEKKDALRLLGAQLIEVPAVPYKDPNNYVKVSDRLAQQLAKSEPRGAIWANQFDNIANREAHVETTGPEIWRQTDGKVDGFICSVGTGGTLAGVSMALKLRNPKIADVTVLSPRSVLINAKGVGVTSVMIFSGAKVNAFDVVVRPGPVAQAPSPVLLDTEVHSIIVQRADKVTDHVFVRDGQKAWMELGDVKAATEAVKK